MKADPNEIARFARRSQSAMTLFRLVSEQPRTRKEVAVDFVVDRAGVERRDVVRLFRELEALQAGRLVVGRRKQKTRLVWSDGLDVLALAKESVAKASTGDDGLGPQEAGVQGAEPESSIRHRYVLRPSFAVDLTLPADLTPREAERLAEFIKTLPFTGVS